MTTEDAYKTLADSVGHLEQRHDHVDPADFQADVVHNACLAVLKERPAPPPIKPNAQGNIPFLSFLKRYNYPNPRAMEEETVAAFTDAAAQLNPDYGPEQAASDKAAALAILFDGEAWETVRDYFRNVHGRDLEAEPKMA